MRRAPAVTGAEHRVDNLAAYKRLIGLCEELSTLADQCWSPTAAAAVRVCSALVRRVASGLYRGTLADSTEQG